LISELEKAGNSWHEINTRVLQLSHEGKTPGVYRGVPVGEYSRLRSVDKALQDYLAWQKRAWRR